MPAMSCSGCNPLLPGQLVVGALHHACRRASGAEQRQGYHERASDPMGSDSGAGDTVVPHAGRPAVLAFERTNWGALRGWALRSPAQHLAGSSGTTRRSACAYSRSGQRGLDPCRADDTVGHRRIPADRHPDKGRRLGDVQLARDPRPDARPGTVPDSVRLVIKYKSVLGRVELVLRRVLKRHVHTELVERPKAGFAMPLDLWLRRDLREWAKDLLHRPRRRRCEITVGGTLGRSSSQLAASALGSPDVPELACCVLDLALAGRVRVAASTNTRRTERKFNQ